MKPIFKMILIVALLGVWVSVPGCGDPNAEFRPSKENTPNVPISEGRSGNSRSFLPSEDLED